MKTISLPRFSQEVPPPTPERLKALIHYWQRRADHGDQFAARQVERLQRQLRQIQPDTPQDADHLTEALLLAAEVLVLHGEMVDVFVVGSNGCQEACWLMGRNARPDRVEIRQWWDHDDLDRDVAITAIRLPEATRRRLESVARAQRQAQA